MSRPGAIANPVLAALTAILAGLWWWSIQADRQTARRAVELSLSARFNPDDVREAVITRPGVQARVTREGPLWRLVEPVEAPADALEVGRLLEALASVADGTLIPAHELRDTPRSELGFDPPASRVTLVRPGGDLLFEIGQPLPGGRLYARLVPPDAYVAVSTNLLATLPASPEALRDRTLFPGLSDIRQIRLRRPGGRLHLARGEDGQWRITEPIQARADRLAAQRMVETLLTTRIREFIRDDVVIGDPYGLDESATELVVDAGPGADSRSLRLGRRSDNDPTTVYAQRGGSRTVVTIPAAVAWMCAATLEDLRDRRLVPLSPDDVAGWCTERGDVRLRVIQTNNVWAIVEPTFAPADEPRVTAFIREWLGTRIEAFADGTPAPTSAVHLCWYRNDPGSVRTSTGLVPAIVLQVADTPIDPVPVAVMESGVTNVVLIRSKPPGALSLDPLRFRSRVIVTLPSERVAGLVLRRGNVEQRILVSTNGFVTERGDVVPTAGVEPKLRALESLRALTLVTESAAEVVSYGLDPPVASLTVLDRAEAGGSVTLLFGRSTPDGTYVRIQGRDLVALLDPATAGTLLTDLLPAGSPPNPTGTAP